MRRRRGLYDRPGIRRRELKPIGFDTLDLSSVSAFILSRIPLARAAPPMSGGRWSTEDYSKE
jgi:hypothetical protein